MTPMYEPEREVVLFFGPNTPTAKDKYDEFLKRFERNNAEA